VSNLRLRPLGRRIKKNLSPLLSQVTTASFPILTDSFIVPSLLFLHYSISSNPHLHPYQGLRFDLKPRRRTLNRYTLVQSQSTSKPRSFVSAQHLHLRQTLNLVILSILGTEIVTVTTLISPHFLYFT
jgi:hypothetical protein